jgi:hypothetical protein
MTSRDDSPLGRVCRFCDSGVQLKEDIPYRDLILFSSQAGCGIWSLAPMTAEVAQQQQAA